MTNIENALFWLYVKTWGKFGDHVINEKSLWTFCAEDLRTALMEIAYPRKEEKSERVEALTDMIMENFENVTAFHEWSFKIHQETTKQQRPLKILKWDPGECSNLLQKCWYNYFCTKISISEHGCLIDSTKLALKPSLKFQNTTVNRNKYLL